MFPAPQEYWNRINALEMKCYNESKGYNARILYSEVIKNIDGGCQIRDKTDTATLPIVCNYFL